MAKNKYTVMQTYCNKMIFDRDREKLDRQKEEVVRIVEEYKKNTL